jgi:hypothetical protein
VSTDTETGAAPSAPLPEPATGPRVDLGTAAEEPPDELLDEPATQALKQMRMGREAAEDDQKR